MACKRVLLFAAVLLLGASGIANGQPVCAMQTPATTTARAEGLAELMSDLVITCTGGTPTPLGVAVPTADISVTLSVPITSRLLMLSGAWSEPLLMMDEPGFFTNPQQLVCADPTGICAITGTDTGVAVYDGSPTRPNIFQGTLTNPNTVLFKSIPIDPPGLSGVRTIRIVNLRANANQLGLTPPGTITATVTTSPGGLLLTNPTPIVAFTTRGLDFTVSATPTFSRCGSENPDLADNPGAAGVSQFSLVFQERFASAFMTRTAAYFVDANTSPSPFPQNFPSWIPLTETGFFSPGFPTVALRGDLALAGLADQGTRLMARFTGVPAQVKLFSAAVANLTSHGASGVVRMVNTDTAGAGAFAPAAASGLGIVPIPVDVNGTATAVYEVLKSMSPAVEQVAIPIYVAYSAVPGSGQVNVAGDFAPVSTLTSASDIAPVPRFTDLAPTNAFTIDTCEPPPDTGRMTGAGSVLISGGQATHSFALHCKKTSPPNSLQVSWGSGNKFQLDVLTSAACQDNPAIASNPPNAGFDTLTGAGTGRLNGVAGATAQWTVTDAGEPGRDDTAAITIRNAAGAVVLAVSGKLDNGNHQAHRK